MVGLRPLGANNSLDRQGQGDITACHVLACLLVATVAMGPPIIVVIPAIGVRITFHPVILDNSSIMVGIVVRQVLQVVPLSNLKAWGHPVLRVKDLNITHQGRPTLIPNNSRWPKEDIPPIVIMDRPITMGLRGPQACNLLEECLTLLVRIQILVHRRMDIPQTVRTINFKKKFVSVFTFLFPRLIKSNASSLDPKRPYTAHKF